MHLERNNLTAIRAGDRAESSFAEKAPGILASDQLNASQQRALAAKVWAALGLHCQQVAGGDPLCSALVGCVRGAVSRPELPRTRGMWNEPSKAPWR